MSRGKRTKNKPPSRQKYEKNNPTVSARMSTANRDKLRLVLQETGNNSFKSPNRLRD